MSPYSNIAIPAFNFGPPTSNSYSLHERQSFFANSLKRKGGVIFYSLQNRAFLKKKRTPDEGVRPDPVGTNVLPDEGLHPPYGFGGRTFCPTRAFVRLMVLADAPPLPQGPSSRLPRCFVSGALPAQSDSEGSGRLDATYSAHALPA